MKHAAIAAVAGLAISTPAMAGGYLGLGGGFGITTLDHPAVPCCDPYSTVQYDNSSPAFGVDLVMGYRIRTWGVEIAHTDFDSINSHTSAEGHTGTGFAVGDLRYIGDATDKVEDRSSRVVITKTFQWAPEFGATFNVGAHAWERGILSETHTMTVEYQSLGTPPQTVPVVIASTHTASWRSVNDVDATYGAALEIGGERAQLVLGVQRYEGLKITMPYLRAAYFLN